MVIRFNVRNNKIVDVRGKQQTAHGVQSSKLKFRVVGKINYINSNYHLYKLKD